MSVPYDPMSPARRHAFLLAVDHLISPWKYSDHERAERTEILKKLNWQIASQKLDFTISPEIPI